MSDVPGPTTQRPGHGKGVRGREPEWERGVGKKRGPGEGRRGSSGGGRSPGEEPRPGHRRPQERPPPTETLANQSAVCLGDGQEPVQGGQVCGAVTSPGCAVLPRGGVCTDPASGPRPPCPLLRLSVPRSAARAQGGWRGGSPWTQLCRTHAYTSSLPAQRQGELGGPEPTKAPHSLGLRDTGSVHGADSSPPLGLSASPPVGTRRVPTPPTGAISLLAEPRGFKILLKYSWFTFFLFWFAMLC